MPGSAFNSSFVALLMSTRSLALVAVLEAACFALDLAAVVLGFAGAVCGCEEATPTPRIKISPAKIILLNCFFIFFSPFFPSKALPCLFATLLCFVTTNSSLPVGWPHLAALYPALIASASSIYLPFFVLPYQRVPGL